MIILRKCSSRVKSGTSHFTAQAPISPDRFSYDAYDMFSVFISSGDRIRLILGVARVAGGTAGWARSLYSQRFSAVKRYQSLHSGESLY